MTVYNLNISSYPHSNMISYSDMLSNVSDQLTSKFLVIGVCIVVVALWHIFGGDKRTDRMSMEVTGALDMIALVFGMYLIALYAIVYWGVNL